MRRAERLNRQRKQFWRQRRTYLATRMAAARGVSIGSQTPVPPCINDGEHDWIWEGQTMDGNIWSCKRCKALRFA